MILKGGVNKMGFGNNGHSKARYEVHVYRDGKSCHNPFRTDSLEFGLRVIQSEARSLVDYLKSKGNGGRYVVSTIDNRESDPSKRVLSSEVL